MSNEKETTHLSKFLSLVLRHEPETIGIVLDESGWADVNILIQQANKNGVNLTIETLKHIVETNNKKRFRFNDSLSKIRASQGHSIQVNLGYIKREPPKILFHGTGLSSVDSILRSGIDKGKRHHVHLSLDIETAFSVGVRYGKPAVFEIDSARMHTDGFEFYLSDNGVWLTDYVPTKYLRLESRGED